VKKVCKCLYDAIFASLQTLERACRRPGGIASLYPRLLIRFAFSCYARLLRVDVSVIRGYRFALPSVIALVKLRRAKGSYATLSRATHEVGSGGQGLPPYIGSLLPMCAIPKCQCTTSLRHVEVYRHTNGCHRLFL